MKRVPRQDDAIVTLQVRLTLAQRKAIHRAALEADTSANAFVVEAAMDRVAALGESDCTDADEEVSA